MRFHREGYTITGSIFLGLVLLNSLFYILLPLWWFQGLLGFGSLIFLGLVIQFFRNPLRQTPIDSKYIIAPADGKVVVIEETIENEYFQEARRQISIFMSPLNVHVNRNPVGGTVRYFKYHAGKYLVAWHPKSSIENERTTLVLQTQSGIPILLRQIAGAVARRICWYVEEGQEVQQGDEFGFIKFGSRVDVFVPLDAKIKVEIGHKTRGGETILAELAK